MAGHDNAPLADWVADEVVAILVGVLGMRADDTILNNLRFKNFASAINGGSWLSAFAGSGESLTCNFRHAPDGFELKLYPTQGRQPTFVQRQAHREAQAKLDDLWERRLGDPQEAPAASVPGPRSRLSPLAQRAA